MTFGGPQDLRIRRVQFNGGADIVFSDAAPRDATTFFATNPVWSSATGVLITVENPGTREATLAVTAH